MSKTSHKSYIRKLRCVVCGRSPCHAAHVRYSDAQYGKHNPGMGGRAKDCWCVPLCHDCHIGHKGQHSQGERQWWEDKAIDPLPIAKALWAVSGNLDKGSEIIRSAYFDLGIPI